MAGAVAATAMMLVGCSADASDHTETIHLNITQTAPELPREVEVPLGSTVVIEGVSEVSDKLHVHGYEEIRDLVPEQDYNVEFTADIAGQFEVETHDPQAVWIKLVVK